MANYTRFQLRGDTKANWLSVNPILAEREPALETDTNRFKIGDGVSTYSQLSYGRNTGEYASVYNVTSLYPLPSGFYEHSTAILAVPSGERILGLIITYETASGVWYTKRFIGTDIANWGVAANWEKLPDAGDLAQLRSDLNEISEKVTKTLYDYTPSAKWSNVVLPSSVNYRIRYTINSAGNYQIAYNSVGTATGATYIVGSSSTAVYHEAGVYWVDVLILSACNYLQVSTGEGSFSGVDNVNIIDLDWTPKSAITEINLSITAINQDITKSKELDPYACQFYSLDLKRYIQKNGIFFGAGTWGGVNNAYKHCYVRVSEGDVIHIENSTISACYYAFMADVIEPIQGAVIGNIGDIIGLNISQITTTTTPSGANYLIVPILNNSVEVLPLVLTINGYDIISSLQGKLNNLFTDVSKSKSDIVFISKMTDSVIEPLPINLIDVNSPKRGYLYSKAANFTTDGTGHYLSNIMNVEGLSKVSVVIASGEQAGATKSIAFSDNIGFTSYLSALNSTTIPGVINTLDVPVGSKYMIIDIGTSESTYNAIVANGAATQVQGGNIIDTYPEFGEIEYNLKGKSIDDINKRLDLLEAVTVGPTGCDFTSVLRALKETASNVKLRIKAGTYNIMQEYIDYYGADFWTNYTGYDGNPDEFMRGLWLGKGRRIEGESQAVLNWDYTGAPNSAINTYFSLIADIADDNEINNITLQANGQLRYIVHDDFTGYANPRPSGKMVYDKVILKGKTSTHSLIGGGMGYYNTYILKDCIFKPDEVNPLYRDAFWHNSNGPLVTAKNRIFVTGCYGKNMLTFMNNGVATSISEVYVSNSKFYTINREYSAGATIENVSLEKWNCVEEVVG